MYFVHQQKRWADSLPPPPHTLPFPFQRPSADNSTRAILIILVTFWLLFRDRYDTVSETTQIKILLGICIVPARRLKNDDRSPHKITFADFFLPRVRHIYNLYNWRISTHIVECRIAINIIWPSSGNTNSFDLMTTVLRNTRTYIL
jgi:hypothetical protein